MSGFIHGEVSWVEQSQVVAIHIKKMMSAVDHYPWSWTSIREMSRQPLAGVMGIHSMAQPRDHRDHLGGSESPFQVAADLNLHARDDLVARLDLSRDDEPALPEELVIRAYQRWGLEFGRRILGEGVFALWDGSEQRLVCWRDAAGVRPLYYSYMPGRQFVFSSDLQSLAAHPAIAGHFDLEYANAFLRNEQFQHPTRTLIKEVRKVPSAHVLIVDRAGIQVRRYWDPSRIVERNRSDDDLAAEELLELLRRSIGDRLPSSGEGVGAHLSGGLDSSSVAVTAADILRSRGQVLSAFSWAPPRDVVTSIEHDERDLVEAAARVGGIRPRFTRLTPGDIVDVAYRDVALRPRATLNFEVASSRDAVASGVRTIFSGWGGDEMIAFNGRGYFSDLARHGRVVKVHQELKSRSRIHGGSLLGAWKARVFLPLLPHRVKGSESERRAPLPAELLPEFALLLATAEQLEHAYPRERPGVHRMQASLLEFGHLQYRMESWAAHGAALGLTYTYPLLDRRIMEFALGLPGAMFFRDGWKRWLYRKAMGGVLPDIVRWSPSKYDNAAGFHLRNVLLENANEYKEPLRRRQDNPLVDVGLLLAEQERQLQLRSSGAARVPTPSSPIGGGAWLAFTQLLPA